MFNYAIIKCKLFIYNTEGVCIKKTDVFFQIKADLSHIGLIRDSSFPRYFCTPLNAIIFANTGVDGVHFCVVPNEKNPTLEQSPVYVVSPTMPDHYVEAIAENFNDFISIVVSAKDATLLECISYCARDGFYKGIQSIPDDNFEIKTAISAFSSTFPAKMIVDVYDFVRQVQGKLKHETLQFSEEYYELTGQTR